MKELERILVVDDDEDMRIMFEVALESMDDFAVQVCASGTEAVALAPEFRPDLLLLDVKMPDMDGPSTLERLRGMPATADTPAVFLSAGVGPEEAQRYREMGAAAVLSKPFDPSELASRLGEIWREVGP